MFQRFFGSVQLWQPDQQLQREQCVWKWAVRRRTKIYSSHSLCLEQYKLSRKNNQINLTKKKLIELSNKEKIEIKQMKTAPNVECTGYDY